MLFNSDKKNLSPILFLKKLTALSLEYGPDWPYTVVLAALERFLEFGLVPIYWLLNIGKLKKN